MSDDELPAERPARMVKTLARPKKKPATGIAKESLSEYPASSPPLVDAPASKGPSVGVSGGAYYGDPQRDAKSELLKEQIAKGNALLGAPHPPAYSFLGGLLQGIPAAVGQYRAQRAGNLLADRQNAFESENAAAKHRLYPGAFPDDQIHPTGPPPVHQPSETELAEHQMGGDIPPDVTAQLAALRGSEAFPPSGAPAPPGGGGPPLTPEDSMSALLGTPPQIEPVPALRRQMNPAALFGH